MSRTAITVTVTTVLVLVTGCGKHYWNKPGGSLDDFSHDSGTCAREHAMYANAERTYGIVHLDMYRACLRQQGWIRAQQQEPVPYGWFRGIEDDDPVRLDAVPAQPQLAPAAVARPGRSQTNFGGARP
jgi:hypothetical protein